MSDEQSPRGQVVNFPADHGWAKIELFIRQKSEHLHPAMVAWTLEDMRPRYRQMFGDGLHINIPCETEAHREAANHASEIVTKAVQDFYHRAFVAMMELEMELYQAKFESGAPQPPKPTTRSTAKVVKFDQG